MYINRYPKTNKAEKVTTDSCNIQDRFNNNSIDMDITIDKSGMRQSKVTVGFDLTDYEFLHNQFIKALKKEIDLKEEENRKQFKVSEFLTWILFSDFNTEEFYQSSLNDIKEIIDMGFIERLGELNIKSPVNNKIIKEQLKFISSNPHQSNVINWRS